MRATDLFRAAGDLGSDSEVAMIVTGLGLVSVEGMFVAQCEGCDLLVLADHPVDGEMLRAVAPPGTRIEGRL